MNINTSDIQKRNTELNDSEIKQKKLKLKSTPQYMTIGAHYSCNAKCTFCLGGEYPDFTLDRYKELFEEKLQDVMEKAMHVGYCGFGEVLLMPEILKFLDHINKKLPDTTKVFTTNGIPLNQKVCEKLNDGKYSVLISLHASNPGLHRKITRVKAFEGIIENIKNLKKIKKEKESPLHINLIFLVTALNIEDLPSFIKMAAELNVERVTCNYVNVFDPSQVEMSCYFMKDKTNEIFSESKELAEELGITAVLPPFFGVKDDKIESIPCRDPWEFFYVETQGSVLPCCNAGGHIGYLDKQDFDEIWNSEGYTRLRKGFLDNNPYKWCEFCPRYRISNINDIRGHITFRPETQEKLIQYIMNNEDKFGKISELTSYEKK